MDWTALERSRTLLRRRVERAVKCPELLFGAECFQLLSWLRAHPVFGPTLSRVGPPDDQAQKAVRYIDENLGGAQPLVVERLSRDDERERTALYIAILDACASNRAGTNSREGDRREYYRQLLVGLENTAHHAPTPRLRDVALAGLALYLEERIELGYGVVEAILRFKQRSEHFHREQLRAAAESEGGERALTRELYEYVFDRNLEFTVEEDTGAGWPDLVLRSPTGGFGVLDAKYLKVDEPAAFRRTLATGFHQVARYCASKNESSGVLAAFGSTERYPVPDIDRWDGLLSLAINSVRVFFVMIDICDRPSGSKLDLAKQVTIPKADLLREPESSLSGP